MPVAVRYVWYSWLWKVASFWLNQVSNIPPLLRVASFVLSGPGGGTFLLVCVAGWWWKDKPGLVVWPHPWYFFRQPCVWGSSSSWWLLVSWWCPPTTYPPLLPPATALLFGRVPHFVDQLFPGAGFLHLVLLVCSFLDPTLSIYLGLYSFYLSILGAFVCFDISCRKFSKCSEDF